MIKSSQKLEPTEVELRKIVIDFMSNFETLTPEEVEALADLIKVQFFKKGTFLYKEGENWGYCYHVLQGALRQYLVLDGVERTTQFFFENESAVKFTNHEYSSLADSCLICMEDSILMYGNNDPVEEEEIYKKFPNLRQITKMGAEQDLAKAQDALTRYITSSPEERYLNLINNRPDLLQRVPQNQIASYIGITPESLSRIRKRIVVR